MFSKFTYTLCKIYKGVGMRKIDMKQVREVLRLHLIANLSARKIQGATGVARTMVQEYIKR